MFIPAYIQLSLVIIVLVMAPTKQSASFVFTQVNDYYSGQDNQGFAILLSFLMPCWTFVGYDASAHVSEETVEAFKQAPKGIVYSIVASGTGGLLMILALLFSIQDEFSVLSSVYPSTLMQLFLDATNGNQAVSCYLMSLIIAANYCAGASTVMANSRMIYAFSRDKAFGFSFSSFLYWTSPGSQLPIRTIWFSATLANCIQAMAFGNSTALSSAASISTIGLMTAYIIPIFCRLTFARSTFKKGDFHLGIFSEVIGWIACVWGTFLFVLLCLPYSYPVTAANMNYASVMIGGITFFAAAFWLFSARHWFRGPVPRVSEEELQAMESSVGAKKEEFV
ncbi:hypothetical protein HDU93_004197 [Gonapodya sp. JEL0774]|nr:hypothetical protein HDU93_004197 [Gonapodya sp. JEL0774]